VLLAIGHLVARGTARSGSRDVRDGRHVTRSARRLVRVRRLRDGTRVRIRPLLAEDRGLLLAGFGRLSGRSRYSRFLRGVSDGQFEKMLPVLLDSVDQRSHIAVVLVAERRLIGVGRLLRSASDPSVADLAVTVADDWQHRGAGSILAQEVLARARGVREIQTVVSEDNRASLRMLARLGELRTDCSHGSCDVVVRVNGARS
jgi:ribosomal protein S18 acetylase RimI-like enzyme